jgi:hypothetical protein
MEHYARRPLERLLGRRRPLVLMGPRFESVEVPGCASGGFFERFLSSSLELGRFVLDGNRQSRNHSQNSE